MKVKFAIGIACVLIIAIMVVVILNAPKSPNGPPPSPNAFDMLLQAGEQMTPLPLDFDSSQDIEQLKRYLDENADSLVLIDLAASQQCMVPDSQMLVADDALAAIGSIRGAFRLQFVKARVEELEGRSEDAASTLVKMSVLGKRSSTGGSMVHEMVAIAVEMQANEAIMQLAPTLSEDQKAEIRKMVTSEIQDELEVDAEIEAIMQREMYVTKLRYGTISGTFMIWQTRNLDHGEQGLRQAMLEQREQRESLLEMLEPAS